MNVDESPLNRSVASHAEELIRTMVLEGTLRAGERLNEVALAESLGISRGPVREAIKRLSGQGLLTMAPRRGAFVKSYEPKEIIDLYELRAALELYAVRLAVYRASDEDLQELEDWLVHGQEPSDEAEGQKGEPYVAELDFHQRLVQLSGNEAIQRELADANHKLFLALRPTQRTTNRKKHAVSVHLEILEEVQKRNVEESLELLSAHLSDSMSNSLNVLGLADTSNLLNIEGKGV